jgi:uncharacterized membrane protein YccC
VSGARDFGKRVLPSGAIEQFRRLRSLLRYLRTLSYEVYDRQKTYHVEELEGELIARRPDITERMMKDLLERTDILLQELHRQVEALRARQGSDLREVRARVEELANQVQKLRSDLQAVRGEPTTVPGSAT